MGSVFYVIHHVFLLLAIRQRTLDPPVCLLSTAQDAITMHDDYPSTLLE